MTNGHSISKRRRIPSLIMYLDNVSKKLKKNNCRANIGKTIDVFYPEKDSQFKERIQNEKK